MIESWRDACPLRGCCSECGVEFAWRLVAGEDRMPRWFVECERRRGFSGVRTLVRSLAPWIFWRRIRMTMAVRWVIWSYPLRLLGLAVLLGSLATGARAWLTMGALLDHDPEAVLFNTGLTMIAPGLWIPIDGVVDRFRPGWSNAGPPRSAPPPFLVRAEIGSRTLSAPPLRCAAGVWRPARLSAQLTLEALACSVATFVVLPVVRRRARVRWLHILRAAVYALAIVLVLVVLRWALDLEWMVRMGLTSGVIAPYNAAAQRPMPWEVVLIPMLLLGWWWCVSERYLRLQRPLAVALSVAAVGSVGGLSLHFVLAPGDLNLVDHLL